MIVTVTNQRSFKEGWVTGPLYFEEKVLAAIGVGHVFRRTTVLGKIAVGEPLSRREVRGREVL